MSVLQEDSYTHANAITANVATPVVRDRHVFVSSNYDTGGALLEITPTADGADTREVYFTDSMHNHHSSSVLGGEPRAPRESSGARQGQKAVARSA